jgi:phosphatidylserine/phosphatidylglycerophosphate/cardiolipin synthase-like enzyme
MGIAVPPSTINTFSLEDLEAFTRDGSFPPGAAPEVRTLFTQRDHVHEALKWLIGLARQSLIITMFGYDDDELDDLIRDKLDSQHVFVQLSLDRSQAGGKHESAILAKWNHDQRTNSVAIGTAAHGGIAHMKAGVIDGRIVFDGSTNWSLGGEGAPGEKGQNNSVVVIDNHATAVQYRTQLDIDHDVMLKQMAKRAKEQRQRKRTTGTSRDGKDGDAPARAPARRATRPRATRAARSGS